MIYHKIIQKPKEVIMIPIKDNNSSGIFPVATIGIIVITVFVFGIEFFSNDLESLIFRFALVPTSINFLNISTLTTFLSSIFLHAGFMHLLFNMWFLGIFGDNVEAALGKIKFVLFYLSGGIIAGLAQYIFLTKESIPILGASGAIAAVLGFYLIKYPHRTVKTFVPYFRAVITIDLPSQVVLGLWFFAQILNGTASLAVQTAASSGVAWWAHIGGFVYGLLIGKMSLILSKKRI